MDEGKVFLTVMVGAFEPVSHAFTHHSQVKRWLAERGFIKPITVSRVDGQYRVWPKTIESDIQIVVSVEGVTKVWSRDGNGTAELLIAMHRALKGTNAGVL